MTKTALITGASSGLGKEFATIHASKGENVIITARRKSALMELKERLEKEYNIDVTVITADLSQSDAPALIYETVKEKNISIDYLINNAGFGGHGPFHERELEADLSMIEVNIKSLTALTRLFLPEMISKGSGRILNVSSTASYLPGPLQAVYYATKAYVTSFSHAIAEEVKGTGVTVTALCPGPVQTEFAQTANAEHVSAFKYAPKPEKVAMIGYKAMMKGKLAVIDSLMLRFLLKVIVPILPMRLVLIISRKSME